MLRPAEPAEYFARIFSGVSVAADGIESLTRLVEGSGKSDGQRQKPKGQRGKSSPQQPSTAPSQLEDLIEDFPETITGGVGANQFRSMVRVARGMFPNGLYLLLETDGGVGWTATARLPKGRQYLDAEPDVIFSRYGATPHDWTVVGTIGHFAEHSPPDAHSEADLLNADGSVSRAKFVAGLSSMMSSVANLGFADSPPFPGFAIIPLAVYRTIPQAVRSGSA